MVCSNDTSSCEIDDDSSTEREMQKIWDKLDRMEATKLELEKQRRKEKKSIEWPSSSCNSEDENLSTSCPRKPSIEDIQGESIPVSKNASLFPSNSSKTTHFGKGRYLKSPGKSMSASTTGDKSSCDPNPAGRPTKIAHSSSEALKSKEEEQTTGQNITSTSSKRIAGWNNKSSDVIVDSNCKAEDSKSPESNHPKQEANSSIGSRTKNLTVQNGIPAIRFESNCNAVRSRARSNTGRPKIDKKVMDKTDWESPGTDSDSSSTSSTSGSSTSTSDSSLSSSTTSSCTGTSSSTKTVVDQDKQEAKVQNEVKTSVLMLKPCPHQATDSRDIHRVENTYSKLSSSNKTTNLRPDTTGQHSRTTHSNALVIKQRAVRDKNQVPSHDDLVTGIEMERTENDRGADAKTKFSPHLFPYEDSTKTEDPEAVASVPTQNSSQYQERRQDNVRSHLYSDMTWSKYMHPSNDEAPPSRLTNHSHIPDHHEQTTNATEIDSSYYLPPTVQDCLPPVLHSLDNENFPSISRHRIPVRDLFQAPISNLWTSKFERFNELQSAISSAACYSDDHMVVSAPTGSGKTAIFEIAMARFFSVDLNSQLAARQNGQKHVTKKRKIVYIAPSKSLCEERYEDWCSRLALTGIGIQVVIVTGDADPGRCYQDLEDAHVIISTPEKWDSITRRWTEKFFLLASVKLFMIDEVHLLGDESRGSCLESIISRMKSIQQAAQAVRVSQNEINSSSYKETDTESIGSCMRVVAVSATLPNITDVAEFIGASEAHAFDESFRPVPLAKHVVGLGYVGKNEYKFWSNLDRHVPELIQKFSRGKQTLVFCHTKKETEKLVGELLKAGLGTETINDVGSVPGTIQHCLRYGIAYHHAGMEPSDRKAIEQAFLNRQLKCLCATSTLAVGVNLPAHLVIVKGTRTWRGGGSGYQEIDRSSLLQMIGRAGRPGLDTSGTAVIMTDNKSKPSIQTMMQGLGPAESYLLPRLTDVMNVEISQRVIPDICSIVNWLKTTFFYVRLKASPEKYGCQLGKTLDSHLHSIGQDTITRLRETGLVSSGEDGIIVPLEPCHIMSQNMISFGAMKRIIDLPSDTSQAGLLKALSDMTELHLPVRRNEKKFLNECHKSALIRFKLDGPLSKVRIQSPSQKAFVLLQAYIGQFEFQSYTLGQEMTNLADTAQRLLLAAQDYSIQGSKNGHIALLCFKLRRSLHFCLWGESSGVLNQITDPKVGQRSTMNLKFGGITSFEHVTLSTEDAIEKAAGRGKPFGQKLKSAVSMIQKEKMKISADIEYTRSNLAAGVTCTVEPSEPAIASLTGDQIKVSFSLLAYTDRAGTSVFFEGSIGGSGSYNFPCPKRFGELHIYLLGSMIGIDERLVLKGNDTSLRSTTEGKVQKPRRIRNSVNTGTMEGHLVAKSCSDCFAHVEAPQVYKHPPQMASKKPDARRPIRNKKFREDRRCENKSLFTSAQRSKAAGTEDAVGNASIPPLCRLSKSFKDQERQTAPQVSSSQLADPGQSECRTGIAKNASPGQANGERTAPFVTPPYQAPTTIDRRQPRMQSQTTTQSSRYLQSHQSSKKSKMSTNAWRQAKRKQERSQQRAFSSRKDNPFAFFQHDPNDTEAFLEGLSTRGTSTSSIIPERELEKETLEIASRMPRNKRVTNNGGRHTPNPKRRRHTRISPLQDVSNEELLRSKAAEHCAFSVGSNVATFPHGASPVATPGPEQRQTQRVSDNQLDSIEKDLNATEPSSYPWGNCWGQLHESYMLQPHTTLEKCHEGFSDDTDYTNGDQGCMWDFHSAVVDQLQRFPLCTPAQGNSPSVYNTHTPVINMDESPQEAYLPFDSRGNAEDAEFEKAFF